MRRSDGSVKQSQVIIDFGNGSHSGARRPAGGLLLNTDGRAEAFDGVHVGALHLVKELAGIGAERVDISPLAFSVNGVKCERRFAGTAQPGDDRERVARNDHADVFQVVLARSTHRDIADCQVGKPRTKIGAHRTLGRAVCTTLLRILLVNSMGGQTRWLCV